MKIVASAITLAFSGIALAGCSALTSQTYCLEEQEKNSYDYMVVTDSSVCEEQTDDVEWFSTSNYLNYGDIAYVEFDGKHSKVNAKKQNQIKAPATIPVYTPPVAPRFTVPPRATVNNQVPAQRVNVPTQQNRVQNNNGSISRGSSNAGSVSSGRK